MKNKLLSVFFALILTVNTSVFADEIKIFLNGQEIPPLPEQHQSAIIKDDILYLPLRNVFEAMGADVIYNSEDDLETVSGGAGIIYYANNIGEQKLYVNGNEYNLGYATIKVNNRVLIIPDALKYIFNANVNYSNFKVDISYSEDSSIWNIDYSDAPTEVN